MAKVAKSNHKAKSGKKQAAAKDEVSAKKTKVAKGKHKTKRVANQAGAKNKKRAAHSRHVLRGPFVESRRLCVRGSLDRPQQ